MGSWTYHSIMFIFNSVPLDTYVVRVNTTSLPTFSRKCRKGNLWTKSAMRFPPIMAAGATSVVGARKDPSLKLCRRADTFDDTMREFDSHRREGGKVSHGTVDGAVY